MKADLSFITATDHDINQLAVSYPYFAEKSHLYSRAYGMLTGEHRGITGPDEEHLRSYVVNDCLRREVVAGLWSVSNMAEKKIGYKLSDKYLVTSPEEWRGTAKVALYPGLEKLEVTLNYYDLETDVTLNYWAQEGLTLYTDSGVVIARVDSEIFKNPSFAYLRNQTQGNKLIPIDKTHSLYGSKDGTDWLFPLTSNVVPSLVTDDINAYHTRYVTVTTLKPDISSYTEGGSIKPTYPDSDQIIPHRVVSETDSAITYQFDVWVLIDPSFQDETVDWQRFETYKLYESFSLRYVVEEPEYLTVIWTEGDDQYTYQYDPDDEDAEDLPRLTAKIANHERGIVHLYANNKLLQDLTPYWHFICGGRRLKMPESLDVLIPVKTSVNALPERYSSQVDTIKEAILGKVAAELPVDDCGCRQDTGFIARQQGEYGNFYMNPFTGIEATKTSFGQRHGQQVYNQVMDEVQIYRTPIRVGQST